MLLKLVFAYRTSQHLDKLSDTAMSLLNSSPSTHLLLRKPSTVGLSYHCLM